MATAAITTEISRMAPITSDTPESSIFLLVRERFQHGREIHSHQFRFDTILFRVTSYWTGCITILTSGVTRLLGDR